jgi:DNA replication protein DnaC
MSYRVLNQEDADALYRVYPNLGKSHLSYCPSCGKNKGVGVDGEVQLDSGLWTCNCRDQLQRHKFYLDAGIGATYQFLSWQDYRGDPVAGDMIGAYCSDIDSMVEAGAGAYIWSGMNGNGKSFLATLMAKAAICAGYETYFTPYASLLASYKAGWDDSQYAKWFRHKIDAAQFLVLDDVGKELGVKGFSDNFATQTLDTLIRSRTQQGRPTVITSNVNPDEIVDTYKNAVWSLISETSTVFAVEGEDYRPHKKLQKVGARRIW